MMLLPSILISVLNSILTAFSDVYVAVLGVYFKLQTFIYMPANGIVQGMRPIIGYNYAPVKVPASNQQYDTACSLRQD